MQEPQWQPVAAQNQSALEHFTLLFSEDIDVLEMLTQAH
jgi:hypothetical protein